MVSQRVSRFAKRTYADCFALQGERKTRFSKLREEQTARCVYEGVIFFLFLRFSSMLNYQTSQQVNFAGRKLPAGHTVSNRTPDGPIGSRQRFLGGKATQLCRDVAKVRLEGDLPAAGKQRGRLLLL